MPSTVLSCVVDRQPRFYLQALNWMTGLRAVVDRSARLEIHHVGQIPNWFARLAEKFEARVSRIEPFGEGPARYCNKLQQLERLSDLDSDIFILSDADILFLSSPSEWFQTDAVRAKIVDRANPPGDILQSLLDQAGFSSQSLNCSPEFDPNSRTHRLNCNGGLYILNKDHLKKLCDPWKKWARYCLGQGELLGPKLYHADQLGFMLAMLELELPFEPLPAEANFPAHYGPSRYDGRTIDSISTLHYHGRVDREGLLLTTGAPEVDAYIKMANHVLLNQVGPSIAPDAKQEIAATRRRLGFASWRRRRAREIWSAAIYSDLLYPLRQTLKTAKRGAKAIRSVTTIGAWSVATKRSQAT